MQNTIMRNTISFETAKLLQKKMDEGNFTKIGSYYYDYCWVWHPRFKKYVLASLREFYFSRDYGMDYSFIAPTIYNLQAVFREKHGIHIKVDPTAEGDWTYKTVAVISEKDIPVFQGERSSEDIEDIIPHEGLSGGSFATYELALESGLYELLKL